MGGSAILDAAAKLRDAIREAAAKHLGCAAAEVDIVDDTAVGPGRSSLALKELAGISVDGTYASNKRTYSYGAHAVHVAVDAKIGRVDVLDYVAVEDVGRIINPETCMASASARSCRASAARCWSSWSTTRTANC